MKTILLKKIEIIDKSSQYQKTIYEIISSSHQFGQFIFKINPVLGAIKSLKRETRNVPNVAGLYFVFDQVTKDINQHCFKINDLIYELIYFGKAGQKSDGSQVKQKLPGRINNVISDNIIGLKNIKRALYWENILNERKKDFFLVIWCETKTNCVSEETKIYNSLKENNIVYPLLNKKRGRNVITT